MLDRRSVRSDFIRRTSSSGSQSESEDDDDDDDDDDDEITSFWKGLRDTSGSGVRGSTRRTGLLKDGRWRSGCSGGRGARGEGGGAAFRFFGLGLSSGVGGRFAPHFRNSACRALTFVLSPLIS